MSERVCSAGRSVGRSVGRSDVGALAISIHSSCCAQRLSGTKINHVFLSTFCVFVLQFCWSCCSESLLRGPWVLLPLQLRSELTDAKSGRVTCAGLRDSLLGQLKSARFQCPQTRRVRKERGNSRRPSRAGLWGFSRHILSTVTRHVSGRVVVLDCRRDSTFIFQKSPKQEVGALQ